jgi:CRP-like cAMP-binding protein
MALLCTLALMLLLCAETLTIAICALCTGLLLVLQVSVMGAGDFFGEGGLVLNMPRSASIRAVTPIQVIR